MKIDFLQNTFMLYIVASMFVTWACLANSRKYRNSTELDKLKETVFCCALTGAISVPLVDYFTTIPSSIVLFIGALVGILGYDGIINILSKIIEVAVNIVPSILSGVFNVPNYYRPNIFNKRDTNDVEEPPPVRKRIKK